MRIVWFFVGLLALAFYALGAFDLWATLTNWPPYIKAMDANLIAWTQSYPLWLKALLIVSVGCGVVGALLLLLRSRYSALLLSLAFLLMIGGVAYDFSYADGMRYYGAEGIVGWGVLAVLSFLFVLAGFGSRRVAAASNGGHVAMSDGHSAAAGHEETASSQHGHTEEQHQVDDHHTDEHHTDEHHTDEHHGDDHTPHAH